MLLLILEAFAALAALVFIVWWTMFSGRRRGERAVDSRLLEAERSAEATSADSTDAESRQRPPGP